MTIKILIVLTFWENKQTRSRLLVLANLSQFCPLKYHVIFIFTFIPWIFERVQRWRLSWLGSVWLPRNFKRRTEITKECASLSSQLYRTIIINGTVTSRGNPGNNSYAIFFFLCGGGAEGNKVHYCNVLGFEIFRRQIWTCKSIKHVRLSRW